MYIQKNEIDQAREKAENFLMNAEFIENMSSPSYVDLFVYISNAGMIANSIHDENLIQRAETMRNSAKDAAMAHLDDVFKAIQENDSAESILRKAFAIGKEFGIPVPTLKVSITFPKVVERREYEKWCNAGGDYPMDSICMTICGWWDLLSSPMIVRIPNYDQILLKPEYDKIGVNRCDTAYLIETLNFVENLKKVIKDTVETEIRSGSHAWIANAKQAYAESVFDSIYCEVIEDDSPKDKDATVRKIIRDMRDDDTFFMGRFVK